MRAGRTPSVQTASITISAEQNHQCPWCPRSYVCWFVNHGKFRYTSQHKPWYWTYKPTVDICHITEDLDLVVGGLSLAGEPHSTWGLHAPWPRGRSRSIFTSSRDMLLGTPYPWKYAMASSLWKISLYTDGRSAGSGVCSYWAVPTGVFESKCGQKLVSSWQQGLQSAQLFLAPPCMFDAYTSALLTPFFLGGRFPVAAFLLKNGLNVFKSCWTPYLSMDFPQISHRFPTDFLIESAFLALEPGRWDWLHPLAPWRHLPRQTLRCWECPASAKWQSHNSRWCPRNYDSSRNGNPNGNHRKLWV